MMYCLRASPGGGDDCDFGNSPQSLEYESKHGANSLSGVNQGSFDSCAGAMYHLSLGTHFSCCGSPR
jgi:hypothetical protein